MSQPNIIFSFFLSDKISYSSLNFSLPQIHMLILSELSLFLLISMVNFLLIVFRGNIIIKQRPENYLKLLHNKDKNSLISRTLICIYFDLYLVIHNNKDDVLHSTWYK